MFTSSPNHYRRNIGTAANFKATPAYTAYDNHMTGKESRG